MCQIAGIFLAPLPTVAAFIVVVNNENYSQQGIINPHLVQIYLALRSTKKDSLHCGQTIPLLVRLDLRELLMLHKEVRTSIQLHHLPFQP